VTAFEARDRDLLRQPSRWIAWIMTFIYLFCATAGAFAVSWKNEHLPELTPEPTTVQEKAIPAIIPDEKAGCQTYYPLIVIAAYQ
jgi:hypothetical protein